MALLLPNSTFLMIPRTGSTWARQAIRNAGIRYKEHGPKHSTSLPPGRPFIFTFTREPEAWVKSRWALGPWEDELTDFWDKDPAVFRQRVTDAMVQMYMKKFTQLAQFVGQQERLADDLVRALTQAGEKFDEAALRATPKYNVTDFAKKEIVLWEDNAANRKPNRVPILVPSLP